MALTEVWQALSNVPTDGKVRFAFRSFVPTLYTLPE